MEGEAGRLALGAGDGIGRVLTAAGVVGAAGRDCCACCAVRPAGCAEASLFGAGTLLARASSVAAREGTFPAPGGDVARSVRRDGCVRACRACAVRVAATVVSEASRGVPRGHR
jgi:hypothetical protein